MISLSRYGLREAFVMLEYPFPVPLLRTANHTCLPVGKYLEEHSLSRNI